MTVGETFHRMTAAAARLPRTAVLRIAPTMIFRFMAGVSHWLQAQSSPSRMVIITTVFNIVESFTYPIKSKCDDKSRIKRELIRGKRSGQKKPAVVVLPELIGVDDMLFCFSSESGICYLNDFLPGNCGEQAP